MSGNEEYEQQDNDEASTDESTKRKEREGDSDGSLFKKSKKTHRTPQKGQQKAEDEKLDQILGLMKDLKGEVSEIRKEQRVYREEIRKLQVENNNLKEENRSIRKENKEIKAELKEIKRNVEVMEKERKRNNVVMTGMKTDDDPEVLGKAVKNTIKEYLGVEIKAKTIRKLGPETCRIELENESEKRRVMEKKSKLKERKDARVFINDDLTKKELERQKNIRKIAKEEKEKGKKVIIGYKKLIVDGKEWRWSADSERLEMKEAKN